MTEKERTASEIRAYCGAATAGMVEIYTADAIGTRRPCEIADLTFWANARTDLPRALDAAAKLRKHLCVYARVIGTTWGLKELLDETAWLADSPEAPVSPDGESGGESENDG